MLYFNKLGDNVSISGGMALQGNPWSCSCENTWLSKWLLRWMRETLQLHASVVERSQNIQSIVRTITCQVKILSKKHQIVLKISLE